MRFIREVTREIHHSDILTADVSLCSVTTIPLQPLSYNREYNEHFTSESRSVAVITTTIRMIRTTAQPEGNTGECTGGGECTTGGK